MLFELRVPNPVGPSVYQQHRYIDMMMWSTRQYGWQSRDYVWCENDGLLFVRRAQPTDDLHWQPVVPPRQDSRITLQVTARCRVNTLSEAKLFGYRQKHIDEVASLIQRLGVEVAQQTMMARGWTAEDITALIALVDQPKRPSNRRYGARPSITDSFDVLTWFERIGEAKGLRIEDTETETVQRVIDIPRKRKREGFILTLTSFTAVATVIDSGRFERALTQGIGDSKAYGCGYIHVWEREHA